MRKYLIFFLLSILVEATYNQLVAQEKYCGTSEAREQLQKEYPELISKINTLEKQDKEFFLQNLLTKKEGVSSGIIYTIPVVFHIIHNHGPENISESQVIDAIRILNEDFRKQNKDTTKIIDPFKGIAGDAEIQFRLAQKDPNGNCSTGIDRIASTKTYAVDESSKLRPWPRSKYLNVWVVNKIRNGTVAGYSYFPADVDYLPARDGVLVDYQYVGSIEQGSIPRSRTLTHEVGHWLNLPHPWGTNNLAGEKCGDDGIEDTPITKGYDLGCPDLINGTKICNPVIIENAQNYMDYSYCTNMFTKNQVTLMRTTLNASTAQRNNLWTPSNLIATGTDGSAAQLCTAEFRADYNYVCEGSTVTFTDKAWNSRPTNWNWSFPGGIPNTSKDSIPKIKYNTAGNFDVTLTAGNTTGTKTTIKTGFIKVFSTIAKYDTAYFENFEGEALPNADWNLNNDAAPGWQKTTTARYSGRASMAFNNFFNNSSSISAAISPTIDLTRITRPKLYFRLAFAQKTATDNDRLQVFVSTDCGKTWTPRYDKYNTTTNPLSTVVPQTNVFIPTNRNQWRLETINLAIHASSKKVLFKFEFTSGGGNNIYIDDISVSEINVEVAEPSYALNFTVYPNPINELSVIAFNLMDKQKINLKIYDLLGKEVYKVVDEEVDEGEHQYTISQNLKPGMYFVNILVDGKSFTQKMIVN